MTPTAEDIKQLQKALEKNPTNTDIMNALALGYFENPSLVKDNEDLKLLERAYKTKKTIKSTHNLAWYYFLEFGATLEEAIKIQQECISMNPKSFYPYFLYGCMLLQNNQYSEAIKYLEIAYSKEQKRDIANDLGIAYAKQGIFTSAKNYLTQAVNQEDIENKSKYNLALVQIQLREKKQALAIAEELKQIIIDSSDKFHDIDSFEVAYLYYLLDDDDTAYSCCRMSDWNSYDLFSWECVSYLIYKNNTEVFKKLVASELEKKKTWIKANKDNDDYWEDDTEEEKQQELAERESEITRLTNLEAEFAVDKPNIDINDRYLLESCGCLLFDCPRHDNLKDDE
ncbi:MAG: tetratricopeptide repeat protein [Rivularia sp. (in: cyanobacteria)]